MGFFSEFKTFATKGNVMDMAVGVVVGSAFSAIVSSLVADVIMPPIGMLTGGADFKELKIVLKEAVGETPAVTLNYGNFIQTIVNFLLIALSVFCVVRIINKTKAKMDAKKLAEAEAAKKAAEEEAAKKAAEEAAKPKAEDYLAEIVTLLKEKN
ncbi:MAG: large-conductance mechanosensitive channel protein MscL [Clostridia bacterium]|nr:large-conductance mechanosensitive channel protein MscL [Clostridia bacterium]